MQLIITNIQPTFAPDKDFAVLCYLDPDVASILKRFNHEFCSQVYAAADDRRVIERHLGLKPDSVGWPMQPAQYKAGDEILSLGTNGEAVHYHLVARKPEGVTVSCMVFDLESWQQGMEAVLPNSAVSVGGLFDMKVPRPGSQGLTPLFNALFSSLLPTAKVGEHKADVPKSSGVTEAGIKRLRKACEAVVHGDDCIAHAMTLAEDVDLILALAAAHESAGDPSTAKAALAQAESFAARQSRRIADQQRENDELVGEVTHLRQLHADTERLLETASRESAQARGELANANNMLSHVTRERDGAREAATAFAEAKAQMNSDLIDARNLAQAHHERAEREERRANALLDEVGKARFALGCAHATNDRLRETMQSLQQDADECRATSIRLGAELTAEKAKNENPKWAPDAQRYRKLRRYWVQIGYGDKQLRLAELDAVIDNLPDHPQK